VKANSAEEKEAVTTLDTASFGTISYRDEEAIHFPLGLPGFEEERRFITIDLSSLQPLIVLQSLNRPDLFFLTLPVEDIDARYDLKLLEEYRQVIGARGILPRLVVLAIVSVPETGPPTANLLGPVVIHSAHRLGVQAIRDDSRYSVAHPLALQGGL